MAKLIFFISLLTAQAWSAEFVLLGQVQWSPETKIGKSYFGGISALAFRDQKLVLLSDDRGYVDEPRFYEFEFKKDGKIWKLENPTLHFLSLPRAPKIREILDPESISIMPDGFLIGSEGDNNKKPRVPPRIFRAHFTGDWFSDIALPDKLIPESTGQQKKGVSNNFAFEALTLSSAKDMLWFITERPLVQDTDVKENFFRYRLFQMKKADTGFQADQELYFEGAMPPAREGVALLHGLSDMIHLGEKRFWFLERSLRVQGKTLTFDCRLLETDFAEASQVQNHASLVQAKDLVSGKIKKIHELTQNDKALGNCEGMLIGPSAEGYAKTLWIVTDNNFSKTDPTILYFFGVKE